MKVAIAINNIFKSIEWVKQAGDFSYEHHLALRLSTFPTHVVMLLDIINDKFIDIEKSYHIIYDKTFTCHGFYKALVLEKEPSLNDYIQYMTALSSGEGVKTIVDNMLRFMRHDAIIDVLKSVGVEVIRTTPRHAVKHIIDALGTVPIKSENDRTDSDFHNNA